MCSLKNKNIKQETILILGAYSLHATVAALLLQPIKWHMKTVPLCLETIPENSKISSNNEEGINLQIKNIPIKIPSKYIIICGYLLDILTNNAEDEANIHSSRLTLNNYQRKRKITISSIDHDIEVGSIYGFDTLSRQISIDRASM